MTASVPDLPDSRVVFRRALAVRRRWQRLGVRAVLGAFVLAAAASVMGVQLMVLAGLSGFLAVGCGGVYLLEGRFRTVLTPAGIATRGYVRRTIPWCEVAAFRLHGGGRGQVPGRGRPAAEPHRLVAGVGLDQTPEWNNQPSRRTYSRPKRMSIDVVRTRGRAVRLPAPLVAGLGGDPGFADALLQLEQWRVRYAGSPTVPPAVIR